MIEFHKLIESLKASDQPEATRHAKKLQNSINQYNDALMTSRRLGKDYADKAMTGTSGNQVNFQLTELSHLLELAFANGYMTRHNNELGVDNE